MADTGVVRSDIAMSDLTSPLPPPPISPAARSYPRLYIVCIIQRPSVTAGIVNYSRHHCATALLVRHSKSVLLEHAARPCTSEEKSHPTQRECACIRDQESPARVLSRLHSKRNSSLHPRRPQHSKRIFAPAQQSDFRVCTRRRIYIYRCIYLCMNICVCIVDMTHLF